MNGLKRIFVSIAAQTGRIVDDFENHEAVAEAALREFAGLLARVDVQARSCHAELTDLDHRIEKLQTDEQNWSRRAVAEQQSDRNRALECVRRLQAKQRERAEAEKQRLTVAAALRDIERRRDELKSQLAELQQRRRQLAARQSHAEAQSLALDASWNPTNPSEVFARWESRLSASETLHTPPPPADVFAQEFVEAEEDQALQAKLDELVVSASTAIKP